MGHLKNFALETQESKFDSNLASILGISEDELNQLDYSIETDYGNDDSVYGYVVEFIDPSPKKILKKISRLEQGRYVSLSPWELGDYNNYEQDDYDAQYDAITSEKDYQLKFLEEMINLRKLNGIVTDPESLEAILKRQIFISVIGALETFLSDTFINLTIENETYFRNFIETHPDFKQRKFELREIFTETEKLKETAKKVMMDTIYHNLPTIKQMFTATFKISFPSIKAIYALVLTRHDLVHRNGKTKEGVKIITDSDAIENLISEASKFVNELSTSLERLAFTRLLGDIDDNDLPF